MTLTCMALSFVLWFCLTTLQLNCFIPLFEWLSLRISADMFRKAHEEQEGQLAKQNMIRSV